MCNKTAHPKGCAAACQKPFDTLLQTAEEDGRDFFAALAVREEAAENLVTAVFFRSCTSYCERSENRLIFGIYAKGLLKKSE